MNAQIFGLITAMAVGSTMTAASVYYGGQALANVNAKLNAVTIVDQMSQITQAARRYDDNHSVSLLVTEKFMGTMPRLPDGLSSTGYMMSSTSNDDTGFTGIFVVLAGGRAPAVCREISKATASQSAYESGVALVEVATYIGNDGMPSAGCAVTTDGQYAAWARI